MSIRLPLYTVLDYNNTVEQGGGPASVAGGVAKQFMIPQDTDNIVVKFQASILAGGASATFQTTDDGGVTWYDVARSSIVSNANATTAVWLNIPVIGQTNVQTASLVAAGSVIAVNQTGGSAAASTLTQQTVSGLPVLSQVGRVFLRYTNAVTSIISERVTVKVNSQSNSAN